MSVTVEIVKTENEISTVFGKCRCCLEYGYMKHLWGEHYGTGELEVYGDMLLETFSIAFDQKSNKAFICEPCVARLRDAFNFKKEVIAAANQVEEDSDEYEIDDDTEEAIWNTGLEHEQNTDDDEPSTQYHAEDPKDEYEEVEYLDEFVGSLKAGGSKSGPGPESETVKKKLSRKRKPDNTTRYKNYTRKDLIQALKDIQNGEKTASEAALVYGIPRKTIAAKLHAIRKGNSSILEDENFQPDRQANLIEEIKQILKYTTAVPFKVKACKYYCIFCYNNIDTPSALRAHYINHKYDIDELDKSMRPHFKNEILRVDIMNFSCKVCDVPLKEWNDMFVHFNDCHSIELDEVYTRVIPYKLSGESKMHCALCEQEFPNFQYVDSHMNAHYTNYMCFECGDSFVTEIRLKHHELIHNTGKHPCRHCGKVFSLEKYKKKHEAMVHGDSKLFKCIDCGEQFVKEYERHLHTLKMHQHRIRVVTCEICGKQFDWRPYFLAHMRKAHSTFKKYECCYCKKRFVTKHEKTTHEMRHTGEGKYVCSVCGKNFVTPIELRKHAKRHENEIQYMTTYIEAREAR